MTSAPPVMRWLAPPAVAALVWLVPHAGFDARAWGLLCVFAASIAGLIFQPLPSGAVILISITAANVLGILTVDETLSGFSNSTMWLIVAAFIFAGGFIRTGLGERIAYIIIRLFGATSLRLGYSLILADLLIAPVTPSNTARAGGVLFPVARSIARAFRSEPGPTADRLGSFLIKTLYQGDLVVSAMFLTAMAANPLVARMTRQASGVEITWAQWAIAASLPGALGIALVPYIVYRLCPPELHDTREAQRLSRDRLRDMGPMSRDEKIMMTVFLLALSLWVSGTWHGIQSTTVAYLAIGILLVAGVLKWQDILRETGAWDALIWFGGLLMLADRMNAAGLLTAFASRSSMLVRGVEWPWALAGLLMIYLYSHYAFASMTAHVMAMFPAFFAVAYGLGAPPLLAGLSLGMFSNINAAMTHYATGPAPILFGAGYLSQARWWKIGFVISLAHSAIWLGVGFAWWKLIGLW